MWKKMSIGRWNQTEWKKSSHKERLKEQKNQKMSDSRKNTKKL
jgi:hypothetical protein